VDPVLHQQPHKELHLRWRAAVPNETHRRGGDASEPAELLERTCLDLALWAPMERRPLIILHCGQRNQGKSGLEHCSCA
jgi:hypothetical protein